MSISDKDILFGMFLGLITGIILTFFIAEAYYVNYYQRISIKYNCAQFNNKTGNFEWIKNGK